MIYFVEALKLFGAGALGGAIVIFAMFAFPGNDAL